MAHPGHGGCTIQTICSRRIGGETRNCYVLIPKTEPNTTILAPIENAQKIGLRNIITSEQADELLDHLPEVETSWVKDNAQRRQEYDRIIRAGDLAAIAQMIKELTVQGENGPLNQYDKEMLPRAQKKLLSEIALAKGIEFDSALSLVDQALHV